MKQRVRFLLLALVLTLGLACVSASASEYWDPQYTVSPTEFDLGSISYTEEDKIDLGQVEFTITNTSADLPFTVREAGGASFIEAENSSGDTMSLFAYLTAPNGDPTLDPGESGVFSLRFEVWKYEPELFFGDDLTFNETQNILSIGRTDRDDYLFVQPFPMSITFRLEYEKPVSSDANGPFTFSFWQGEATLTGYDSLAAGRPSHVDVPATATDSDGGQ